MTSTTRLNLGPLTTTSWSPPAVCNTPLAACLTCNLGWLGQVCKDGQITDDQACWPPTSSGVPETKGALGGWGIYSPGIICPSGYVEIATATYGGQSNFNFQFALRKGETALGCCPSGGFFAFRNSANEQTCTSVATTGRILLGTCETSGLFYTDFAIPQTYSSSEINAFTVYAPFIQAVHKAADVSTTTSSSPSSSSSHSSTPTTAPSFGGLSTGAKAGIGIGAALGAIFLATGAFLLWRSIHQKRNQTNIKQQHKLLGQEAKFRELEAPHGQSELGDQSNLSRVVAGSALGVIEMNPQEPAELGSRDDRC
ncbi:hypothetical protein BGZ63DRAFT_397991 [Mariannaea sp. PMI_226]|nr:hypothetical protein BGZ63DRAFT_397991 [Mariannaea sp. PMI_226]